MNDETCVIYIGGYYIVEWFFDDMGHSQAYDFFLHSGDVEKRQFLMLVKRLADFGTISDKKKKIIVTNAFRKKSQKLPKAEKETAVKSKRLYEQRKN